MRYVKHPEGGCFFCQNGQFFDVWYQFDPEKDFAWCEIKFDEKHQGPPGAVHGGVIATILDEVMSMATGNYFPAFLAKLTVEYKRPVPLYVKVKVEGVVRRKSGRKIWVDGRIVLPDGTETTRAVGLYIQPKDFQKIPLREK